LDRVPQEAVAEGEFRALSPEVCAEAKSRLLALAGPGEVCSRVDGFCCKIEVKITEESRPWPRNPGTEQLLHIWSGAATQLGTSVVAEERGGLSDGNSFWDFAPTLDGLGPWGDNDHCSERSSDGSKLPEFVEISSFVPKALLNTAAIRNLLDS
jgi:glutamate carboxypeptidase